MVTDLKFTVKLQESTVEQSELEEKMHFQPFSLELQSSKFLPVLLPTLEPVTGLVDQQEINGIRQTFLNMSEWAAFV